MKVVWSDRALKSLAAIHAHISANSETNAHLVIDRILRRGDQLSTFPLSGRTVSHPSRKNLRELIEQPYRIIYRVRGQRVELVDVLHTARRPPSK